MIISSLKKDYAHGLCALLIVLFAIVLIVFTMLDGSAALKNNIEDLQSSKARAQALQERSRVAQTRTDDMIKNNLVLRNQFPLPTNQEQLDISLAELVTDGERSLSKFGAVSKERNSSTVLTNIIIEDVQHRLVRMDQTLKVSFDGNTLEQVLSALRSLSPAELSITTSDTETSVTFRLSAFGLIAVPSAENGS